MPCAQVKIGLPYTLEFASGAGGVLDKNGVGTGFTWIDKPATGTGYVPANLAVDTASGVLHYTTANGIAYTQANSLVNGLDVGIAAPNQTTVLSTTIVNPPAGTGAFQQAGVSFGIDQDNYDKLVIMSTPSGTVVQHQLEALGATVQSLDSTPQALTGTIDHPDPDGGSDRRDDRRLLRGRGGRRPGARRLPRPARVLQLRRRRDRPDSRNPELRRHLRHPPQRPGADRLRLRALLGHRRSLGRWGRRRYASGDQLHALDILGPDPHRDGVGPGRSAVRHRAVRDDPRDLLRRLGRRRGKSGDHHTREPARARDHGRPGVDGRQRRPLGVALQPVDQRRRCELRHRLTAQRDRVHNQDGRDHGPAARDRKPRDERTRVRPRRQALHRPGGQHRGGGGEQRQHRVRNAERSSRSRPRSSSPT